MKIKKRLLAILLSIATLFSFTATSIVPVSAANYPTGYKDTYYCANGTTHLGNGETITTYLVLSKALRKKLETTNKDMYLHSYSVNNNVVPLVSTIKINKKEASKYGFIDFKIRARRVGSDKIAMCLNSSKNQATNCVYESLQVHSAPTSVKLNYSNITLGNGEVVYSFLKEYTNKGRWAHEDNLKWTSSNPKVAIAYNANRDNSISIEAKGVGTAYIKLKLYNGKTAQCKVTVKNAPSSVRLSKTSLTLNKGASYTISESTNSGSYANPNNQYRFRWTSSNPKVATVTKASGNKAVIKANAKGTAYIKITIYNGKTAQCKVTVK